MGYRRPKDEAAVERRWREFVAVNAARFDEAGLPVALRDQRTFDDFLEHGFVAMPEGLHDGVAFAVADLSPSQRGVLAQVVVEYVAVFGEDRAAVVPEVGNPDLNM
jgi:hypothetical protein